METKRRRRPGICVDASFGNSYTCLVQQNVFLNNNFLWQAYKSRSSNTRQREVGLSQIVHSDAQHGIYQQTINVQINKENFVIRLTEELCNCDPDDCILDFDGFSTGM